MKYFRIDYYKSNSSITYKIIKTKIDANDAIKKSKVKNICEVTEVTEEEYNKYMQMKNNNLQEAFICI